MKGRNELGQFKSGKQHPRWKGNKVGLNSLHEWIKKRKSKSNLCEKCNERPTFDLANISGKYKRDVNDYEWLCRRCHMMSDGRLYARRKEIGVTCDYCGRRFLTWLSKIKRYDHIYCSRQCSVESRRKYPKKLWSEAVKLRKQQLTYKQIAKKFGVKSPASIRDWIVIENQQKMSNAPPLPTARTPTSQDKRRHARG